MCWFSILYLFYFTFQYGQCLWSKGVVHYTINKMDYDLNSQDIILSALEKIQKEICVKFFMTPLKSSFGDDDKILYISNSDKQKNCPPQNYDFTKSLVEMKIGYKCLNDIDISRMMVDMLRASIKPNFQINSFDLDQKFRQESVNESRSLLSSVDRNYINKHYHLECNNIIEHKLPSVRLRSSDSNEVSVDSEQFYKDKLWPLGIVFYGVDDKLNHTEDFHLIRSAMSAIEESSCVVFKEIFSDTTPMPQNFLWFVSENGETMPNLGLSKGNQTLLLSAMLHDTPGHLAHSLNLLMRILGIPMMSNRFDRDIYVTINWKNIQKGMEMYFERLPKEALLKDYNDNLIPYDFGSATHAPDPLWQKTLIMGHRTDLNTIDVETLKSLYDKECESRFLNQD